MGWWKTVEGHTLGDGPLDLLEECNPKPTKPTEIPPTVLLLIMLAYVEDLGVLPTTDEINALVEFCRE